MTVSKRLFSEISRLSRTLPWKTESRSLLQGARQPQCIPNSRKFMAKAYNPFSRPQAPKRGRIIAAAFASGGVLSVLISNQPSPPHNLHLSPEEVPEDESTEIVHDSGVRQIRLAELKDHDGKSEQPWVTRGDSVYDITDWVGAHPGGEVILRAAGGSIDPYWDIFTIHKTQAVYDILEQYFIGKIDSRDLVDGKMPAESIEDPFMDDPVRDSRFRVLTAKPCNAESPGEALSDFLTPNGLFYVRNHMWVPVVEEIKHALTIELTDGEERTYTMQDLKEKFRSYKVTATLQCAGNRRKDMTEHAKKTNGLQWTAGALSNAEWEGVKLRDLLADCGMDMANLPEDAQHAQFMGLEAYGASIPIDKAIDPRGDVIIAFKMNGQDLPRDHGYPIRMIVPGSVAARSVKWLKKITISDEESLSQWQRRDYKCFGPNVEGTPDWENGTSIQEMPITSAITHIRNASQIGDEAEKPVSVEGYAYSGGGRAIIRVDISADNGKTWDQAELLDDAGKGSKAWCWKRWRYNKLTRDLGKTTLLVKATDDAYNTQPESYASIYNARGNLATAWHRVPFGDEKAKL